MSQFTRREFLASSAAVVAGIVTVPSRSYVQPRSVPKARTGGSGGNAAAAGSRAGTSAHSLVVSNEGSVPCPVA